MKSNSTTHSSTIRNSLAFTRTILANKRTLLSYLRTGMTFLIAGAGILKFIQDGIKILIGGWSLIAIGFVFIFWGVYSYRKLERTLEDEKV